MEITTIRIDGVHVVLSATLQEVARDKELLLFAEGLIPKAVRLLTAEEQAQWTVAEALWRANEPLWPFLTVLLALDAEIGLLEETKKWAIPLPGFLSYRNRFQPERVNLQTMRLPALNPDGHYFFGNVAHAGYVVIRLDLHPTLRVCGHVRAVLCGQGRPPQRITPLEYRLERQTLTPSVIDEALVAGQSLMPTGLRQAEAEVLRQALLKL